MTAPSGQTPTVALGGSDSISTERTLVQAKSYKSWINIREKRPTSLLQCSAVYIRGRDALTDDVP